MKRVILVFNHIDQEWRVWLESIKISAGNNTGASGVVTEVMVKLRETSPIAKKFITLDEVPPGQQGWIFV